MGTHYAAIDIHKTVFQAAVLDPATGEVASERFPAERRRLRDWAERWADKLEAVAIEATTGWRWVARELQALGLEVRLADPGRASALQGRRKQAKTDRLHQPDDRGRVRARAGVWSAGARPRPR